MKRITYVSRLSRPLPEGQLRRIGETSAANNARDGITGVLIYVHGLFFQIIEGEDTVIDRLYTRIRRDPRHHDIVCLKAEVNRNERMFPDWSMRLINLDETRDEMIAPIRTLVQHLFESHSIIKHYTPSAVMEILNEGQNPLARTVRQTERVILFCDMVRFAELSENHPMEEVARVLNTFFGVCASHIGEHGGDVSKYMGDCVMAYFPPHRADAAISACFGSLCELTRRREMAEAGSPQSYLRCGFGLAMGPVLEGNFGAVDKVDYTVIGDAVNTASRLEELTREVNRAVLCSAAVREAAGTVWQFDSLGMRSFKGKEKPTHVYAVGHSSVDSSLH